MKKSIRKSDTKIIIAGARLSYPNLFNPRAFSEDQDPKYSASLIISKDDTETIQLIKNAIEAAKEQWKEKWGNKMPANMKQPLRDGDEERPEDEAYQNSYFINCSSKTAPQVVGKTKDKATGKIIQLGEGEVYAGCYVNASVNFYPYNVVSKGIAAGLGNIQKEADGERLGGATTAAEDFDFEEVEVEDDFLA